MMVRMKENKIKTNNEKSGQLELGFSGRPPQQNFQRHTGRVARAAWWFARMREAVEEAIEWPAAPGYTTRQYPRHTGRQYPSFRNAAWAG
jgi:hypothetical protein